MLLHLAEQLQNAKDAAAVCKPGDQVMSHAHLLTYNTSLWVCLVTDLQTANGRCLAIMRCPRTALAAQRFCAAASSTQNDPHQQYNSAILPMTLLSTRQKPAI